MAIHRRLGLSAPGSPDPAPAWFSAARRFFGVDEGGARRLWRALPANLEVRLHDPDELPPLLGSLRGLGLEVQDSAPPFASPPCGDHRGLARDRVCGRCGEVRVCAACALVERPGFCGACRRRERFRRVRVAVLLAVLVVVGIGTWQGQRRVQSWKETLTLRITPVFTTPALREPLEGLVAADFLEVEHFVRSEARRYGVPLDRPLEVRVSAPIESLPPLPPTGGNVAENMLWSLQMRFFGWMAARHHGLEPADLRVFLVYYPPVEGVELPHSTGLPKGRIGAVHAFWAPELEGQAALLVVHETLHTLGALDKYGFGGEPLFPEGYAEPERRPLFPQRKAEIMAGSLALNEGDHRLAEDLGECLVGEETAREIGWLRVRDREKKPLP